MFKIWPNNVDETTNSEAINKVKYFSYGSNVKTVLKKFGCENKTWSSIKKLVLGRKTL